MYLSRGKTWLCNRDVFSYYLCKNAGMVQTWRAVVWHKTPNLAWGWPGCKVDQPPQARPKPRSALHCRNTLAKVSERNSIRTKFFILVNPNQSKFRFIETEFLIRMNERSEWFRWKTWFRFIQIEAEWIELIRIDFWPFFYQRRYKTFFGII